MLYLGGGPHLRSQHIGGKNADLRELRPEASLVYRVSFSTARVTQRNPVLKIKNNKHKKPQEI